MGNRSDCAGWRWDRWCCFAHLKRNPVDLSKRTELGDAGDLLRVLQERQGRGADISEPLDLVARQARFRAELLQSPGEPAVFGGDVRHPLDIINPAEASAQLNFIRAEQASKRCRLKLPMPQKKQEGRRQPVYIRAVSQVLRLMRDLGLSQKQVALGSGLTESEFSQKKVGIENHFTPEEFEDMRQFFKSVTGRPLIGFPHLDWDLQDAVDRKVGGWHPPPTKS